MGGVGGGAGGGALPSLARRAGRQVTLWSRDPSISQAIATKRANPIYLPGVTLEAGIEAARDLAGLASCDALLLVSPAQAVRSLAPRLPGMGPIVICAKGIEGETGLLIPELMTELLPSRPLAVLSGPSFAEEAGLGLPAAISIATAAPHLGRQLAASLAAGSFPPYCERRTPGMALCGHIQTALSYPS